MLRRYRNWFWVMGWCSFISILFVGALLLLFSELGERRSTGPLTHAEEAPSPPLVEEVQAALGEGEELTLVLQRDYVCGERVEEIAKLRGASAEEVAQRYQGWEVVDLKEGQLVLRQEVEDIAPHCKANGFFAIDGNGVLTLYLGPPEEEQVIRSFYQIDIQSLESSLPRETVQYLRDGIRIHTLAEYNSVLSTYSEFAVEKEAAEEQKGSPPAE